MRGCPWTFWWRIGKSARSFSQSIVSFGGAGMTVSVIIALRTLENDECRMTKPDGSPKTEFQIRALDSRSVLRYSRFGFLSSFVIRISSFDLCHSHYVMRHCRLRVDCPSAYTSTFTSFPSTSTL